jgi:hypothetical protein
MNFIKKLKFDIKNKKIINASSKLFILHKRLKLYTITDDNKLPIQCFLGTSYLIKGDNIIEFYAYINPKFSQYIQINKYFNKWSTNISIINVESNDPEDLGFILYEVNKIHCIDNMQYFIKGFLDTGFKIYLNYN